MKNYKITKKKISESLRSTHMATANAVEQEALVSYDLSKSRGNRTQELELLDQLDTHFKSAA